MKLEELEKLAKEATPGPWEAVVRADPRGQPMPYYRALVSLLSTGTESVSVVQRDGQMVDPCIEQQERNAAFIAAHNPERMKRIYELLREAQGHLLNCPCTCVVRTKGLKGKQHSSSCHEPRAELLLAKLEDL